MGEYFPNYHLVISICPSQMHIVVYQQTNSHRCRPRLRYAAARWLVYMPDLARYLFDICQMTLIVKHRLAALFPGHQQTFALI